MDIIVFLFFMGGKSQRNFPGSFSLSNAKKAVAGVIRGT
jgi:hypothetical protein